MDPIRTSIAMTTYNGAHYLDEQLKSFLTQTTLPSELIVVDDCSTDNTMQILSDYKKSAPFDVHIYQNDYNIGYTQNFSKALSLCSGELIFLSDQDDAWMTTKITKLQNLYTKNPTKSVFMSDALLTDNQLTPIKLTALQQFHQTGLPINSFVLGCCIAVTKDFVEQILPVPKEYIGHDNWIVELADILDARLLSHEVLMYYRRHDSNTSNTNSTSLKNLSALKLLAQKFAHKDIIIKNETLLLREELILKTLEKIDHSNKQKAILTLSNKIKIRKKRLKIISNNNILTRFVKSFYLYIHGDYKYFSNLKSFLADTIKI